MTYYFELPEGDGVRYVQYTGLSPYLDCTRIWQESDSGSVSYFRLQGDDYSVSPVDLKEFFFVKLQSQPDNRSRT